MFLSLRTRLWRHSAFQRRLCTVSNPSGAFFAYRYQVPVSAGTLFSLGTRPQVQVYLRAVHPAWVFGATGESLSLTSISTGKIQKLSIFGFHSYTLLPKEDILQIPSCMPPGPDSAYGEEKLVPGALVKTRYGAERAVTFGFVDSVGDSCRFQPVALSQYRPGLSSEEQPPLLPSSGPFQALSGQDILVTRGDIETGMPEMRIVRNTHIAPHSLLVHPRPALRAEALVDGEVAHQLDDTWAFWSALFSPCTHAKELGAAAEAAGLVRSRVDIRLDGETMPVLLLKGQADGEVLPEPDPIAYR
eukprot:gnl/TRDRNA2_/TRDRNA2_175174_c5_seq2.p1 gnl/TRDRNA2_/TRDRNA2_175174_c5~~gnl/TRDRNA2_/TRDRNA2_175174_c5_seq2.p1  ORF type:complete len:302 (-),score=11.53 gnl/TRDRNA2_/TRDRNA2_175174_c5_seq2:565-1470(-)